MTDDQLMIDRTRERDAAEDEITAVLDQIERGAREPDLWEKVMITEALGAAFRGLYALAFSGAQLATTPPTQRSPQARLSATYERFSLETLKRACEELRAQPVLASGYFGPVVLTR